MPRNKTSGAKAEDVRTPRTVEYLLSTPLVADYLAEGLSLMGYACSR